VEYSQSGRSESGWQGIIDLALDEDTGHGDVTGEILIPPGLLGRAKLQAKDSGILAGGEVVREVFLRVDSSLQVELLVADGARVKPGGTIAVISGKVSSILRAERVALNFLQRLSGIATCTAEYVSQIRDLNVTICDTRKTTPGMRLLEKYAVRVGGGQNHRRHLGDGILIKDNHLAALRARGMSLKEIVARAKRDAPPALIVEVEVGSAGEALEAAEAGADVVMLDNVHPDEMRRAVGLLPPGVKTEASGGITLDNIRDVAQTGVNIISVGALTHSPRALDFSLELEPESIVLR